MTDDAIRQAEIQARSWECERSLMVPCRERNGVKHPHYEPMNGDDWCEGCVVLWLLQRLAQVKQEKARLNASVGELLQSVSARESEARQAREAMQSLDVFYVEKRQQLESALAAARQEMAELHDAVRGLRKSLYYYAKPDDGWDEVAHANAYEESRSLVPDDDEEREDAERERDLAAARLRASPPQNEKCQRCNGSGTSDCQNSPDVAHGEPGPCSRCGGSGRLRASEDGTRTSDEDKP